MNLKKCKKLRRIARMLTVGKPARQYWPLANKTLKPGIKERMELFPECTRAVYRMLKKGGVPAMPLALLKGNKTFQKA